MTDESPVGSTIRTMRLATGLSQPQLARRANVSVSLLGKVECGDRVATHAFLAAVARALRVPIERLTGQPYSETRQDEAMHRSVEQLRGVLRRYDLPDDVPPRPLAELAVDVAEVARLRRNADYGKLAARLPALLDELTAAAHLADTATVTSVYRLLTTVYYATHALLYRLGFSDLMDSTDHKLMIAAERTGDPLAGGLARWARVQSFRDAGEYVRGLRLLDAARADLDDELRKPTPAALAVHGCMHLRSVTLAARANDAGTTQDHLSAARDLARAIGGDQVHYELTFGPNNTTTHEVAAQVELGDGPAALAAAQTWAPTRTMPRTRRGHHYIDLARAHLLTGDRASSLQALQQARRIAPQQTRLHPMVRETAAVLVSQHRRSNPELSSYAGWLGLVS